MVNYEVSYRGSLLSGALRSLVIYVPIIKIITHDSNIAVELPLAIETPYAQNVLIQKNQNNC